MIQEDSTRLNLWCYISECMIFIYYINLVFIKNICILKCQKIIDALLKIENKTLSSKSFICILTKYDRSLFKQNMYKLLNHSIAKKQGKKNAIKKMKRINSYCSACTNKPTLCFPCFAGLHKWIKYFNYNFYLVWQICFLLFNETYCEK